MTLDRLLRFAFAGLVLATWSTDASSEVVTHEVTATVTSVHVLSGSTSLFTVGQPGLLRYDIERSTPGTTVGTTRSYANAIQSLRLTVGAGDALLAPGASSSTAVTNDVWIAQSGAYADDFVVNVPALSAGSLSGAGLHDLHFQLEAIDGEPFIDMSIPALLDLESFSLRELGVQFVDPVSGSPGQLAFRVDGLVVAASPTSWGRVKGLYAR